MLVYLFIVRCCVYKEFQYQLTKWQVGVSFSNGKYYKVEISKF